MPDQVQHTPLPPLSPSDMALLERAFLSSLSTIGLRSNQPEAVRLAALAIRLYQSGMRDEKLLRHALLAASDETASLEHH